MSHEELQQLVPGYVLDALDPDEGREFEAHLSDCETCQQTVRELGPVATELAFAIPQVDPPDTLRASILRAVAGEAAGRTAGATERGHRDWCARARYAGSPRQACGERAPAARQSRRVAGHRCGGGRVRRLDRVERDAPPAGPTGVTAQEPRRRLCAVQELGRSGTVSSASVSGPRRPAARGTVFVSSAERRGVLFVHNLAPPPSDHVYQLWVIPAGGKPQPGAVFTPSHGAALVHFRKLSQKAVVIAVTIERHRALAPTLPIILQSTPVA